MYQYLHSSHVLGLLFFFTVQSSLLPNRVKVFIVILPISFRFKRALFKYSQPGVHKSKSDSICYSVLLYEARKLMRYITRSLTWIVYVRSW